MELRSLTSLSPVALGPLVRSATRAVCPVTLTVAMALSLPGLAQAEPDSAPNSLAALVAERGIKGVVIGLPLNMDGSEGPRSQSSRAYARNVSEALGLPVLLWDERWSTASAESALIAQDMSRAKRADRIDAAAAAVILQAAIDALAGGFA